MQTTCVETVAGVTGSTSYNIAEGNAVRQEPDSSDKVLRLSVRVIPRARKNRVVPQGGGKLRVYLTAPPQEGRANEALREVLAEYFGVKRSQVAIVVGQRSREKVVEVVTEEEP